MAEVTGFEPVLLSLTHSDFKSGALPLRLHFHLFGGVGGNRTPRAALGAYQLSPSKRTIITASTESLRGPGIATKDRCCSILTILFGGPCGNRTHKTHHYTPKLLVREVGLEPTRPFGPRLLRTGRLPIPSHSQ